MKAEFELTIDNNGRPCIKFVHHDKSSALEQKMLKIFIDGFKARGVVLTNPCGHISVGTNNSTETYQICIKDEIRPQQPAPSEEGAIQTRS